MTRHLVPVLLLLAASPALAGDGDAACRHGISVTGEAHVTRMPDSAEVSVGTEATGKDAAAALDTASRGAQGIIDLAQKAGVPREDIATESASLTPTYEAPGSSSSPTKPVRAVYLAENTISIRLADLGKLSRLLGDMTAVGGNKIENIRFTLKDPDALVGSLETAAAQNARERARAIASALGVRLGTLCTLSTTGGGEPVQAFRFSGGARADKLQSPVVPIVPKPIERRASVTATFAIDP